MTIFICNACGTSYPDAVAPPAACPICDDERQYIPLAGQLWTAREAMLATQRNAWCQLEPDLFSIQVTPGLGINQRALLVRTPAGNILWDCITLLDPVTEALIRGLGGLAGIAISHPHYYTVMQDWAAAFDCPIHLHAADREWVMRPSAHIRHWEGETLGLLPAVQVVRGGGHYPGGAVLHWSGPAGGVLLCGDILQITPGAHRVSFMWSYPNMMPLPVSEIRAIEARLAPLAYDRIYGAFTGQDVRRDGRGVVARSAARYLELLETGL